MDHEVNPAPGRPTVFVDAEPFAWRWFAGIPRYTARVVLALKAEGVDVRFFHDRVEIEPLSGLSWSPDQDIELWARRVWHGERRPLETPPGGEPRALLRGPAVLATVPVRGERPARPLPADRRLDVPGRGALGVREVLLGRPAQVRRRHLGLALHEGRRRVALADAARSDHRGAFGDEPLPRSASSSEEGSPVAEDRAGRLHGRAEEKRRVPAGLVPQHRGTAPRCGTLVGRPTRMADFASRPPRDEPAAGGTTGPVPGQRVRWRALPPLSDGVVVDLSVGLRGVRLPRRRLAPARDARAHRGE